MQRTPFSNSRTRLALAFLALPIVLSWIILLIQLRAIPMQDDYQALIAFTVSFHQTNGFWARLALAFTAQHDEYKLIFEHLIDAADLALFGHIHYRFLAILGNLSIIALLAVYWRGFFREETLGRRALLFLPVSFLLLQLNYVETLDWAMCGLQMLPVILFCILSVQLLCRDTSRTFLLACLSAMLACMASASGFALAPVGLLLLVQLRGYRRIVAWLVPFGVVGAIYSYHYAATPRAAAIAHPTLLQKIHFFFNFLGGAVENQHHVPVPGIAFVVGCCVMLAAIYALKNRYYLSHPFSFYVGVWIVTTVLGVAQFRTKQGVNSSLGNRYKIYSDVALIFLYEVIANYLFERLQTPAQRRKFYTAAIAITGILYVSSGYFGFKFLKQRRQHMEAGFRQYLKDPGHFSPEVSNTDNPIVGAEPEFSRKVMNQAIAAGVYRVPTYLEPGAGK